MAELSDINLALVTLVNNALVNAGITNAQVGSEWPPKDVLQDAGNDVVPIIAVFHKITVYQSRNMRYVHSVSKQPVGIVSSLSDFSFTPGQSVILTLSYAVDSAAVNLNDIVACALSNGDTNAAASVTAGSGATLDSMATALAAAIETAFPAITATAVGAAITITNDDIVGYHIDTQAGNVTNVAEAVKWASRSMQINVWCGDLTIKFQIQQIIETLLATIDDAQGFQLPSTEWIQLRFHGARPDDAETDKDVYTDFYLFTLDHMVDIPLEMWPVLANKPVLAAVTSLPNNY